MQMSSSTTLFGKCFDALSLSFQTHCKIDEFSNWKRENLLSNFGTKGNAKTQMMFAIHGEGYIVTSLQISIAVCCDDVTWWISSTPSHLARPSFVGMGREKNNNNKRGSHASACRVCFCDRAMREWGNGIHTDDRMRCACDQLWYPAQQLSRSLRPVVLFLNVNIFVTCWRLNKEKRTSWCVSSLGR